MTISILGERSTVNHGSDATLSHPVLKAKPGVHHMCARINLSHMGDQMNIIITVVHKLNEYQSYYIINRVIASAELIKVLS